MAKSFINVDHLQETAIGECLDTLVSGRTYVGLAAVEVEDESIAWSVQTVELPEWVAFEDVLFTKDDIAKTAYSYFESFDDAIAYYVKLCDHETIRNLKI